MQIRGPLGKEEAHVTDQRSPRRRGGPSVQIRGTLGKEEDPCKDKRPSRKGRGTLHRSEVFKEERRTLYKPEAL